MKVKMKGGDRHLYRKIDREIKKENIKKDALNFNRIPQSEIRKFLMKYFLREWKMIIISQAVLFFQTYLNIYQPFFTQDFIEAAIQGRNDLLIELTKVFAMQNAFLIISEPLMEIFIQKFKKRLEIQIQIDIFQEILSKDIQFFEQTKFVQIQQLAQSGSRAVMDLACGDRVFNQLKQIFRAIGHCYFLFYKSITISLILLGFCVARGIWSHFSYKWRMVLAKTNYQDLIERDNKFQDTLQNVMTVKAFGREVKEVKAYQEQLQKIQKQNTKIEFQNQQLSVVNEILNKLQKIIVLYYGSVLFLQNNEIPKVSTITTLLQYSHSFTQLYNAVKELIGYDDQNMYIMVEAVVKLFNLKSNQGLAEDIFVDLTRSDSNIHQKRQKVDQKQQKQPENDTNNSKDIPLQDQNKEDDSRQNLIDDQNNLNQQNQKKQVLLGDITFENVKFKYGTRAQDEEYILKDISLKIKGGEFVAFAGTSGSGKSTIIKLIERFYDVNEGSILIDGENVKDISLGVLRTQIGLVQQEPVLFDTSIIENITYGVDAFTQEQVKEICDISGVSEFVFDKDRFPDGLDTLVGSKGLMLSGGQKQRVAIARALIKRPKILIFDEATSSLDAESEFQVQKYIDQLVKQRGMTIVVVAHRLSTIVNCDRIYLMSKGEIIEQGSHKELLELNGFYKQLINRQLYNDENTEFFGLNNGQQENNNENEIQINSNDDLIEKVKKSQRKEKIYSSNIDDQNTPKKDQKLQEINGENNIENKNKNENTSPIKSQQYSEKKQKLNLINEQIQQQMIQRSELIQKINNNLINNNVNDNSVSQQKNNLSQISFSADGLTQEQTDLMIKKIQIMIEKEKLTLINNQGDKKND